MALYILTSLEHSNSKFWASLVGSNWAIFNHFHSVHSLYKHGEIFGRNTIATMYSAILRYNIKMQFNKIAVWESA